MKGMKFPGMGGMGNMQGMLQKVQKMQASGGGAVKVTVTGKKELTGVVIDPQVVDPEDVEMLQDLILAAVNEALHQVDTVTEAEMNKVTGGLKIPGM